MKRVLKKIAFYAKSVSRSCVPKSYFLARLPELLAAAEAHDPRYIEDRVNYYLKHDGRIPLSPQAVAIQDYKQGSQSAAYYYDLKEYLDYFPSHLRVAYRFGDDTHLEPFPTLVKARPIGGDNANSILFKLNRVRHFRFVKDAWAFRKKKDMAVWRGGAYRQHRRQFVQAYWQQPNCDIGQTNRPPENVPWQKEYMSINEQLQHKFILSVEGNDVATNLKWIMSSNSVCMMRRPRFETWFMEGRLEGGKHFIQLADDFSDIGEKIDYYSRHPDEAEAIIANAQQYVAQFRLAQRERIIALRVLQKYFELTGQPVFSPEKQPTKRPGRWRSVTPLVRGTGS